MLLSARRSSTPMRRRASARAHQGPVGLRRGDPLRDARGFDARTRARGATPHAELTDEDPGLANVILTNGARLYVDHAHPEYSSPEVTNPLDAVRVGQGGRAGHGSGGRARARASPGRRADQPLQEQHRQQGRVLRHARELPHATARRRSPTSCGTSTPVLRHPAGRSPAPAASGSGRSGRRAGLPALAARRLLRGRGRPGDHAASARSSTPATSRTPTRTEYRRLHVIIGDANLPRSSTYLSSAPPRSCSR